MSSPLKERTPRLPGQSLDEYLQDFTEKKVAALFFEIVLVSAFIIFAWVSFYFPLEQLSAIALTLVGTLSIFLLILAMRTNLKKARNLKLGRDGERVVGQHLEELRTAGCSVFHDVRGKNFNIDHILVCPQGIFTIETKTRSKKTATEKITFDGKKVGVNGYGDWKSLRQIHGQSTWVQNHIQNKTGRTFNVKPVLVFPGWYVDGESSRLASVKGFWLLNPKALRDFLKNSPQTLSKKDMDLIASNLRTL